MYNNLTDIKLIKLIAKKDAHALRTLYRRYDRLIFGYSYKIVHNKAEAEEVVNEVFMKIWKNPQSYNTERKSKFSSWLIRVCHNKALDKLRVKKGVNVEELKPELVCSPNLVENEIERKESITRLKESIKSLPIEQKQVIEMLYFDGLTQKEVAERTNTPLGTVKSRVKLAMSKLKNEMKGGGPHS